ncbi:MAG: hypothetical protein JO303_15455 [Caulobacteraceae bacterium]|nr:hypothetical protein [Caulobacteraceae bacterium]
MAKADASGKLAGRSRNRILLTTAMAFALAAPVLAQTPDNGTAPPASASPDSTPPSAPPGAAAPSNPSDVQPSPPSAAAPDAGAPAPGPSAPSSTEAGPPGAPVSVAPASPDSAPPPSSPPPAGAAQAPDSGVSVQSLGALDLFSAGRETGLGAGLWKGASADIARAVIPTLDTAPLSPAGAALARAVLGQAATAPDGAGEDADLAGARIKALLDLGDAETAAMILEHTPGLSNNAALSQAAAEVDLITDQPDKACAIAEALSVDRDAAYWLRLRAFCQARAGKPDMAQLTLTLANQQQPDPIFSRLMGAVLAGGANPGAPSLRNGLDYALSTELKLDLTPALAHAAPPIARRLAAMAPPPPPSMAAPNPGAPGAPAQPFTSEADILATLRAAASFPDYVAAAKAAQPAIAGLVQVKAPLNAPVALGAAAIAAGDLADADAIRASLTGDAIPGADALGLALFDAALSSAHGKPDPQTLDRLIELASQAGDKAPAKGGVRSGTLGEQRTRQRAAAAGALMLALGAPLDPPARAAFAGFSLPGDQAAFPRLLALDVAADAGLKGETALLALSIAEAGGGVGPGVADRVRIIRALTRAGMADFAQTYAVEGLVELQAR